MILSKTKFHFKNKIHFNKIMLRKACLQVTHILTKTLKKKSKKSKINGPYISGS